MAAIASDPIAEKAWQDATAALGIGLAACTMLLDPSAIVLGGGLASAGEALLDPVRSELAQRISWRSVPDVELSPLGSRAGVYGAAIRAWQTAGRDDFSGWTAPEPPRAD